MKQIVMAVVAASCLLMIACGDDNGDDKNRPATLGDPCVVGDSTCKSPFSCLELPDTVGGGLRCTETCVNDTDCPTWTATGHCSGEKKSTCLANSVCDPLVCK